MRKNLFGGCFNRCLALYVCLFFEEDGDNTKEYARYNYRSNEEPIVIGTLQRSCAVFFLNKVINTDDEKVTQCYRKQ